MIDETDPAKDSDLRRRAAWLLGMLVVVAVLFVVVLSALLGGGSKNGNAGPGPLDTEVFNSPTTSTHASTRTSSSAGTSSAPSTGTSTASGSASCPTAQRCALSGDVGNAVAAINAYRTQHGQPAVPGAVSPAAQQCALNNGNGCSGGWAETELAKPDGTQAVQKIQSFGHLLDPNAKSFEVGWAYDPGAKLYYFAIIRKD